ncbi:MAG TPA: biopolymer transporter ExbD [Ignavibacteria bacterium]|nr:biopolymer transporter ExbD [Ignavibacteria bacterium]
MKFVKRRANAESGIPTESMADIVFILLLFFMVTTTLRKVDVIVHFTLPKAKAIEKIENKRLIDYIWIGRSGRIQINDSIVKMNQIEPIIYRKRQELHNVIISLRIDVNTKMGEVTDVQQELRKADALRINYSANVKL